MTRKKIVNRIKESLSLASRSSSPQPGPSSSTEEPVASSSMGNMSLANFLEKELKEDYHKLVATSFAEFIKGDTGEQNIDFDHHFQFLGYKQKVKAVELLLKRFPETKPVVFSQTGKNKTGRKRNTFMISFDQYEELLLTAQTAEGDMARKAVLAIKNAVFKFIKIEKIRDLQQLEAQKAQAQQQLEDSNAKRAELEAVQSRLQATIESHRMRDEKKKSRKAQQKTPLEKTYLLSNSPGGLGPFKLGKTASDGKKRAKEMQTGNHEMLTCVFEFPCVNSHLIERVAQHIFWDYRINDKLEWFDAPMESMIAVLQFLVLSVDGLQSVDHDDVPVAGLLSTVTNGLRQELETACQLSPESPQQPDEQDREDSDHESPTGSISNPVSEWMQTVPSQRTQQTKPSLRRSTSIIPGNQELLQAAATSSTAICDRVV